MAELAGLPIPTMDWHSPDAPQAFKKFKARCELYFSGPLKENSEEEQISYLLIWSGDDGIELVSTWNLSATDKKKRSTYWTRFENYLSPKSNFQLARYQLRTMRREPDESVDSFVKKIRILVEECHFTNPDEHIALLMPLSSDPIPSVRKPSSWKKTLLLPLTLHWTLREPKKLLVNKLKEFAAMFLLLLMH